MANERGEENYILLLELDLNRDTYTYQDIQAQINAKASYWKRMKKLDTEHGEQYQRWLALLPQIREKMRDTEFCRAEAERARALREQSAGKEDIHSHTPIYPILLEGEEYRLPWKLS